MPSPTATPEAMERDTHHLIGKEQHSLERELAVAEVEQILQRWSQQINDHRIVIAFLSVPPHEGHTHTARQGLVYLGLIFQLRVLGLDALKLDGYLLTADDVDTEVNITEGARADLLADAVLKDRGEGR